MILIIEFYQNFFFLSFNHIFLYIIGAFDVFLFPFSRWNDNLSYTTISVTKLDDIRLVWRGYIQTMCYHAWVNPRHIFTVLGEHIFTLLEEMNNILLRLLFHTCSNSCELLQVGFVWTSPSWIRPREHLLLLQSAQQLSFFLRYLSSATIRPSLASNL